MPVDIKDSFSASLLPSGNDGHCWVTLHVYDVTGDTTMMYERYVFSSLSAAGKFAEASMWAWITAGLIGIAAFVESQSLRLTL